MLIENMFVPTSQLSALKQKIFESFGDVPYPQDTIAPHECDECWEVRQTFKDQNWKTIAPKILEENHGKIPLFSPAAFRYFLPAYLIYSLQHFENYDTVCQFTIYALAPSNKNITTNPDYWQEKFANFTAEQMNCIYEFLDFVAIDENFECQAIKAKTGKRNLKELIEPNLRK